MRCGRPQRLLCFACERREGLGFTARILRRNPVLAARLGKIYGHWHVMFTRRGFFSEIPFSKSKFYKYFQNTIDQPDTYLGLKVFLGDKILGFSYAYIGGYFIGDGARGVTVNTINVDQSARSGLLGGKIALRLVRGIEVWARKQRANVIPYHVTSGKNVASTDRFFRKVGMTILGRNYGIRIT